MAWYDKDGPNEYYAENIVDMDQAEQLNDMLFGDNGAYLIDPVAEAFFIEAVFEKNPDAYQALVDYLWDNYGIDFEDTLDWQDFRSWYDAQ